MEEEPRFINNRVDGHVKGPAVQAQHIGFISAPSSRVHNVFKEARALNFVPVLYRAMASLAALGALFGVGHGGTPIAGAAVVCDWLAIPSGWTAPTGSWVAERSELLATVAGFPLSIGLLALPKPRQMAGDLTRALEWRAPSTVVASFSILVQCGYTWSALLVIIVLAASGLRATREASSERRTEYVLAAAGGILLAVFFVPIYAFAWLLARDTGSTAYFPERS
ncbi:hypothetical protein ITI46_18620 [Streptomyces oryzae]|uniref:Yip1 domain-containing protein n=1 Tax=Streptomyces oryzae TaxID=1434886 RepID=A0ABS3XEE1_9ACTN|nr:hypothetical protein [Streptomyces oryzae]MBO8193659.1 hypothetical protein [Streptomyces oryzae]